MSPDTIRIIISVTSGSLALCFNGLLAVIILTTKCNFIGNYKYLLFLYTVSAAMYSIAQITTAGNFLMFRDGYLFYDTFRILPIDVGNIAVDMYVSSFVQNVVILTLSFSYRYLVICHPRGLEIFIRHWISIALVCILIITYVMATIIYALRPSRPCEEVFGQKFYRATGYALSETAYNGAIVFYHGNFNWVLFFSLGSFSTLLFVSVCIIVSVALKTTRKLRTISTDSQVMANHQRKIFTLLIFQISLPMVFNILPVQFAVISTFFQLPTDDLVHNIGCVLTVAQIIDPLLIFYFIKPYRKALWRRSGSSAGNSQTAPYQQATSNNNTTQGN